MLVECAQCIKRDKHGGLCPHVIGADKQPLRCVGPWAKDKHYYLSRYIDTLTSGMKNKWPKITYVELFSGPGRCIVRQSSEIIDGSPLVALNIAKPFSEYHFVELDPVSLKALELRCDATGLGSRSSFYPGDCNVVVNDVLAHISDDALGLAFIDPTGAHIDFATIEKLAEGRRMDLIITFPLGVDIRRNIESLAGNPEETRLDRFMGNGEWRRIYNDFSSGKITSVNRPLIDLYKERLSSIGYKVTTAGDDIPIRSASKNLPLYHILFASKHDLGAKFWNVSTKQKSDGQMTIPFATN